MKHFISGLFLCLFAGRVAGSVSENLSDVPEGYFGPVSGWWIGLSVLTAIVVYVCTRRSVRQRLSSALEANRKLETANAELERTAGRCARSLEIAGIFLWELDLTNGSVRFDENRSDVSRLLQAGETVDGYLERVHPADREKVRKRYAELLAGGSESFGGEFRMRNNIGGYEWLDVHAVVDRRDETGRAETLAGCSALVTMRKKTERELETARRRADESNRQKSAFLANMSHEIRTPLNAIVGFSNILASTEDETERQEYLRIIENNNELLLQLINDILDLSKIEAGTLEFIYSDFNLNPLMRELEQTATMRAASGQVRVILEGGADECALRCDKNRLTQVLMNMLTNALKFTEKGTVRFGYRLDETGDMLRFEVADTGCGISQDKLEAVFGRFVRLDGSSKGTGLGLAICETIIKKLGGEIGVNSEEGRGSTFWFTIPRFAVEPKEREETAEDEKSEILVAEDTDSNYRLVESILKRQYRLVRAGNGLEAVECFRHRHPELILMDISMPEMDGYGAVREIRKLSTDVPIIAVTAYAFGSDQEKIMQNGFNAYLSKPIDAVLLQKTIDSFLGAQKG